MNENFLQNKYTKCYYSIIFNAMSRAISTKKQANAVLGYSELHHIIPKCMGGTNEKCNVVYLTAKEHFICHRLLAKMTIGLYKHKMVFAANRMLSGKHRYVPSSRVYQQIKIEFSVAQSITALGRKQSPESRAKMSAALRGHSSYKRTPEIIAKQVSTRKKNNKPNPKKGKSTPQKGKTYDEIYGKEKADELRQTRSNSLRGWVHSEQTKKLWSTVRKGTRRLGQNSNATPITYNGISYDSKKEAYIALGISEYKFNKLLRK